MRLWTKKSGRHSRRRVVLGGSAAVLVAIAVGCSSRSSPAATVSGFISNQSSAAAPLPAPPTLLASLFDLLSPVGPAYAGRGGVVVSLAGGARVTTDAYGFFIVSRSAGGDQLVQFQTGSATFRRGLVAPRGGSVSLGAVSLQSDGSAPSSSTIFDLSGSILGANCGANPRTLTVSTPDRVRVTLSADAVIQTSFGPGCAALNDALPEIVFVHGTEASDGSLTATWVQTSFVDPSDLTEFPATVDRTACTTAASVTRSDGEPIPLDLSSAVYNKGLASCRDLDSVRNVRVLGRTRGTAFAATLVFAE